MNPMGMPHNDVDAGAPLFLELQWLSLVLAVFQYFLIFVTHLLDNRASTVVFIVYGTHSHACRRSWLGRATITLVIMIFALFSVFP
jgi:hypothetical protein